MPLALVWEFETHHGEILKSGKKNKRERDQLPRAPSVGRRDSTRRVDDGRKSSRLLLATKMQGTNTSGGGGEPAL